MTARSDWTLLEVYKQSLSSKKARIKKFLSDVACDHLYTDIVPTAVEQGFRSRAKFRIYGTLQKFRVMGTDPLSGEVPAPDAMWILPDWGRKLVTDTLGFISENLSDHWIDGLEIQLTHGSRYAHLALSAKRSCRRSYTELANLLMNKIPFLKGVSIPSQKSDFGDPYLLHNIHGKKFFSHYAAFFQSNLQLTPILLEVVRERFQKRRARRIIDFYCGIGLFSLFLTRNDGAIVGVDNGKKAIESARKNAEFQGVTQASFFCSSVDMYAQHARLLPDDFVLIDPPRSGCSDSLIEAIAGQGPHQVCSISCCLETHIRNLENWIRKGYTIQSFSAFDMFPFTEFLETVALLGKKV